MSEVRVRIAPSPTGDPHVGTAYIGLFNMAFARHSGGKFVLRIEDTDRERSTKESEAAIFRALHWVGLRWDEGPDVGGPYGPYRQSERSDIYGKHARQLVESGHAYRCFCTPERLDAMREEMKAKKLPPMYDGRCRDLPADEVKSLLDAATPSVIRLKVPRDGETAYVDLIRKKGEPVVFQNSVIDDQVLLKSDGFPTYHLANVVDDHLMRISHVVRAEEWVNSTPKHILLYRAFGWEPPVYVHMPLLRNPDKSKISKRKNPTSLDWYREQGYLPEAILNFLALMGWSAEEGKEVFDIETIVREFSWDRVSTSAPIFDLQKLEWLNGMYIRALSIDELIERLRPFAAGRLDGGIREVGAQHAVPLHPVPSQSNGGERTRRMVAIIQERMKTLAEFDKWTWFFFTDKLDYGSELLVAKKMTSESAAAALRASAASFAETEDWTTAALEEIGRKLCEEIGLKPNQLFMALRVAVTGSPASPPLFESMEILGKERCVRRLEEAVRRLA